MTSPLLPTYARADLAFERGEGAWLIGARRRALSRFRRRHRRQRARPRPSASGRGADRAGRQALARLEPLPDPGGRAAGAAARRRDLRRHGVLHQFRRRGDRVRDQDGAPVPCRRTASPSASASSPSRAPSTAARWRRIAAGGQEKYLEGLRPEGRGLRPGPLRRHRGARRPRSAPETAAILIEPVQGEGGIRAVPPQLPARAARSSATSTACC